MFEISNIVRLVIGLTQLNPKSLFLSLYHFTPGHRKYYLWQSVHGLLVTLSVSVSYFTK